MIAKYLLASLLLALPTAADAALSCGLSSTGVAFGTWSASTPNSTGTMTLACSGAAEAAYTITLSTGSGTYAARLMHSGTNTLGYNLYTNTNRTNIWGNGTQGTSRVTGNLTIPSNQTATRNITIYGKVAVSPKPSSGAYSDTIVATVTF